MFLDIGLGILIAIAASVFWGVDLTPGVVGFSIFAALSPDLDFIVYRTLIRLGVKRSLHFSNHRDLFHHPLIFLPVGFILSLLIFGGPYPYLFLAGASWHFIHDLWGIGWGIKILFPFSRKNFALFYLYSGSDKKGIRKTIFWFDDEERKRMIKEHKDEHWVRSIYLKFHPIGTVEYIILIYAIFLLILISNQNKVGIGY